MLSRMKKFVSLMICTALLCSLTVIPASAEKVGNIDYVLYEDYDGEAAAKAFDGDNSEVYDFGGRHGKVLKLNNNATADLVNSQAVTVAGGTTDTDGSITPVVFSVDFYVENVATPLELKVTDSAGASVSYLKLQDGNAYASATDTDNQSRGKYNAGAWNTITIYRRWNSTGHAYIYLNGTLLRQNGNTASGIANISVTALKNSTNTDVYIDDVKLFYAPYANTNGTASQSAFEAEAYHDGENVYVETSYTTQGARNGDFTMFGTPETTKIYDTYTGQEIGWTQVLQNGIQLVMKPSTALDAGKEYKIVLADTIKGEHATTRIISNEIYFTAAAKNEVVANAESANYSWKNSDAGITISNETDGSVKVTNADTYNKMVRYGDSTGWVTTKSTKARYLEANLDFKVDTTDFYGRIIFNFTSTFSVCYSICSDGKIRVGMNGATAAGNTGNNLIGEITYNVGEWNNLGIKYDRVKDMFTACVNGKEYDLGAYSWDKTKLQDNLYIFWYTNRAVAGTTNTMYFDNVHIANSATGVDDVKVGTSDVWTKGEISSSETTATVTFDGDLAEGYTGDVNDFVVTADGQTNLVTGVVYDAASKTATLTLGNIAQNTEHTLEVKSITDINGIATAPYTAKFTAAKAEVKDVTLVDADGNEITKANLQANDVVYAKVDVEGGTLPATVIIAQYNGGFMTNAAVKAVNVSNDMAKVSHTVTDTTDLELKVFVWNSIDSLGPLCEAAVY